MAALIVAFVGGLAVGVVASFALRSAAPQDAGSRGERSRVLMSNVDVRTSVNGASLFAAGAFADFGIEDGLQRVNVRIVRRLDLLVEITAPEDVAFGSVPSLCLVGPDSAPDDAGLEDPCWGQPDLSDFLVSRLSTDGFGHPLLRAGQPLAFEATLWRNSTRCDYPTGDWVAQLRGDVVIDGHHTGVRAAPPAPFRVEIPTPEEPLRLVDADDTRYCGLATRVFREQGEPQIASPTP